MDEWGLEALELKAWMVILGTKIGEKSDTHKLIGELGGYTTVHKLYLYCIYVVCVSICFDLLVRFENT